MISLGYRQRSNFFVPHWAPWSRLLRPSLSPESGRDDGMRMGGGCDAPANITWAAGLTGEDLVCAAHATNVLLDS